MHEDSKPEITTVLVAYGAEHYDKTVEWLNSRDLKSTFGIQRSLTVQTHQAWINANTDTQIWAIVNSLGHHVGNVLLKINEIHLSGYFQIYIGERSIRGQGLGERALTATLCRAFDELGLHRVWLHTFLDNLVAERLYVKHGFVLEGTERDALLWNGVFVSQRRWSLLAREWRNGRMGSSK
jgi:RimJ/RimL family protein N-acetyltransferase